MLSTASLSTHLNNPFVLAHRLDHSLPLEHVMPVRFFDIDILAGLARHDCRNRMPVIRRSNHQYINPWIINQSSKIGMSGWFLTINLPDRFLGRRQTTTVNICQRHHVHVFLSRKHPQQRSCSTAYTNAPYLDTFTRRRFAS